MKTLVQYTTTAALFWFAAGPLLERFIAWYSGGDAAITPLPLWSCVESATALTAGLLLFAA